MKAARPVRMGADGKVLRATGVTRRRPTILISEQGKPPDWVIMLASDSTAEANLGSRRDYFESLGVPEYWLLDDTAELHGATLIGNRLVNGRYEPIEIETLLDGSLQGYSAVLGIILRWTSECLNYIGLDGARAEAAEARVRDMVSAGFIHQCLS